jgi:hypothetical protein
MRFLALHEDQIRRGRIPGSHRRHLLAGIKAERERLEAAIEVAAEDRIEQARRGVGPGPQLTWRPDFVPTEQRIKPMLPSAAAKLADPPPIRPPITPADLEQIRGMQNAQSGIYWPAAQASAAKPVPNGCGQSGRYITREEAKMRKPTPIPPSPIPCDTLARVFRLLTAVFKSPITIVTVIAAVCLGCAAVYVAVKADSAPVSSGFRTDGGSK